MPAGRRLIDVLRLQQGQNCLSAKRARGGGRYAAQGKLVCRHMENAYLADPTPTAILEAFEALNESQTIRQKLADGGIKKTAEVTWESEIDRIYDYVQKSLQEDAVPKVAVNG